MPPPKDVYSLVPETCPTVTFKGNTDLGNVMLRTADVMKLRIPSWEDDVDCLVRHDVITKVTHYEREAGWQNEGRRCEDESRHPREKENTEGTTLLTLST